MDFRKALLSAKVLQKGDDGFIGNEFIWPELGKGHERSPVHLASTPLDVVLPTEESPQHSYEPLAHSTVSPHQNSLQRCPPCSKSGVIGRSSQTKPLRPQRRPTDVLSIDIQASHVPQSKIKKSVVWRKPVKKIARNSDLVGNRLDSDNPTRKRGKERERPKKKRLTCFKKAILFEREDKVKREEAKRRASIRAVIANDACLREVCYTLKPGLVPHNLPCQHLPPSYDFQPTPHQLALHLIHHKRFREYCRNIVDFELRECAKELMGNLKMFHDRLYYKDPLKAQSRKRFVVGLKEGRRQLSSNSAQLVFIATDLNIKPGSNLNNILTEVINSCEESGVPCVFADVSTAMARWVHIWKGKVSFITVLDHQGAEDTYKRLIQVWQQKRKEYSAKLNEILKRYSQQDIPPEDSERDLLCATLIEKLTC